MVDDMKNRFRVEAHQRILLPCLCMLDALLIASILLTGEVGRRYNRKKLLWAALAVLFMHVGILGGLNRSVEYVWGIAILYSIVGIGLIASCLYLCRDLLWHYRLPFSRNPKGPSHA
jgi:lipopolysaccharide export LptBFGC system permease protein LptF